MPFLRAPVPPISKCGSTPPSSAGASAPRTALAEPLSCSPSTSPARRAPGPAHDTRCVTPCRGFSSDVSHQGRNGALLVRLVREAVEQHAQMARTQALARTEMACRCSLPLAWGFGVDAGGPAHGHVLAVSGDRARRLRGQTARPGACVGDPGVPRPAAGPATAGTPACVAETDYGGGIATMSAAPGAVS